MKKFVIALSGALLATPVTAESLGNKVGSGLKSIGSAIEKGAEAVSNAADSTNNLIKNEETPEATRAKLDLMADEVISRLLSENPQAAEAYEISAGYAAFDMRRISVFPLQAGYGRGVAINTDGARTYMQMGTGGVGAAFGIGGFESQFVVMFETPIDFERFVEDGFEASADAGSMKGDERTSTEVQFTEGRSFFVLDKTGWRLNANANGTKYWKDEKLN